MQEATLSLLSTERRAKVEKILESWKERTPDEVRLMFNQRREAQTKERRKLAEARTGLAFERVSPRFRAWLSRRIEG
jgi:hypothetical protein